MNKQLYNDTMSKLISLPKDQATPNKIRGLLATWSNRINAIDKVSVLCAFYNYMNGKEGFDFVNSNLDWTSFFKGNFANYFTKEVIKNSFDDIIFDEKMVDLILKFVKESVIKEFYEYTKFQNDFYMKTNNTKYKDVFEKLENKCITMGIIEKTIPTDMTKANEISESTNAGPELTTAAVLNSNFQNAAYAMESHRENVFTPAADKLGVDKSTLVNMVGNSESYKIDGIEIAPELIGMLKSNESKVASVPKGMYIAMKNKISEKKFLRNVELDFVKENGMTTLKLSKKDTIFDKIASTSKEVLNKIKASAKDKALTAMAVGSIGIEIVKASILNTSTIVKQKAKDIQKDAERVLYNAVVAAGTAQMEIQDFAADKKDQVSQKKEELATKTADGLRSFADRIALSQDAISESETKVEPVVAPVATEAPKETYTYINTPQGRAKVVLRAATKAGEVSVKDEISHSKTAA